ncbi:MAG TPA: sensor histidine kinase [Anaerolineales bacterium]|nr:sensor histidine kinase [Anaerolineales bacterium]
MRYLSVYLIYAAIVVRALAAPYEEEQATPVLVFILLLVYGLLLFSEPGLSRRLAWYPWVYLTGQSLVVIAMLFAAPQLDFLPTLFMPLSFQAGLAFERRVSLIWIAAFTLAMVYPLMAGWEWRAAGLMMVLFYTAIDLLMGSYAYLMRRAEVGQQENQRMLGELRAAYRQLLDSAAREEELAAAQERSRLAQELHDSVTQTLFSMNLTVQSARMLLPKNPGQADGQLDHLLDLARSAASEIQMLVSQLRPRSLMKEGLVPALRRLAGEREQRDGLKVALLLEEDGNLPEPLVVGLYRIAQEALNNIAKHAQISEATLRLNLAEHPAFLEVEDHGVGFAPGQVAPSADHFGLAGMAERACQLGWVLRIDSQPGRGTLIRAEEKPE